MANAPGFISRPIPTLKPRNHTTPFGVSRFGYHSFDQFAKRVFLCNTAKCVDESPIASPSKYPPHSRRNQGCKLIGCGSAVPYLKISNNDLSQIVETSDNWITQRAGIHNRRVITGNEKLTDLAADAASKALKMAQVEPDDVDLILMCTSTQEDLFGSAPQISKVLGCKSNPLALCITAACSGFVSGIILAAGCIRGCGFQNVLVIGADAISRYVDWTDRGTCILFGDAAGAVLMQACDEDKDGLLAHDGHSDGDGQKHLEAPLKEDNTDERDINFAINGSMVEFPPSPSSYSLVRMNGKEVFRFAVKYATQSVESSLEKAGLLSSKIDWLLLHQANQKIIDAVASRLHIPPEKALSNLADYGNTNAASIPLALDEAVRSGKVLPGHIIAMAGFGAGFTWVSAIVRWG